MAESLRDRIRSKALALGFAEIRFARAERAKDAAENLARYLAEGRHGDMDWMAANVSRRSDPRAIWPEARSVIVLGENYTPAGDPLAILKRPDRAAISVYAQGRDYHLVLKKRLKALARWVSETEGGAVKVFVDTAPVMEKPLAQAAGLGWQGRHTNLVSRRFGSWLFLGELFTTLDIDADAAESDHCGTCRSCEIACPTNALADGKIDPRRCISYLTIEHKGHIPAELRPAFGNRIYGCDDCLAVCPWNKFAKADGDPDYLPKAELDAPRLAELAMLDDASFRALFSGSAIKRVGRDRFVRNVLIAIGNSGDPELAPVAEALLGDASPLVRAMAVWAWRRLPQSTRDLKQLVNETDIFVQEEWNRTLP